MLAIKKKLAVHTISTKEIVVTKSFDYQFMAKLDEGGREFKTVGERGGRKGYQCY